jgi:hypothetical protein
VRWPSLTGVRRAASAAAVLALVLAGCGHGGGSATIQRSELPRLVLQPKDLGASFSQFDEGKQVRLDAQPGPREDPQRFGREGGWKAHYRFVGTPPAAAAVVESRADLFDSVGGAKKDLDAYRRELGTQIPGSGATAKLLDAPKLGDGSVAAELRQGPAVFFTVAWRESNATASVRVQGRTGATALADALKLARRQAGRMITAAS